MTPLLDPASPHQADADTGREIADHSPKAAILMHTDVNSTTTGWLNDAWRLWARTTEHTDNTR
ncbi:hypothetical protein EIP75_20645 [Aquabacterium soli]|uniref:Uncharacterized protein n=1 Tax=Aquabacterium soli TaxID=2493092 RepID=A0A3R8S4W4_9BURK|nr:hypothetical protein [Aquabacterium soli]RRS02481.1 hypothetical protein EIP75_20645 [Aquabacterium soli]